MKIPKELEKTIANDQARIKSITVEYSESESISGIIVSASFVPLKLKLQRHQTMKGEDSVHNVDFDTALQVVVLYYDNSEATFQ